MYESLDQFVSAALPGPWALANKALLSYIWSAARGGSHLCAGDLQRAVLLDCQPKSKDDAVYVSEKWRSNILNIANAKIGDNVFTALQRFLTARDARVQIEADAEATTSFDAQGFATAAVVSAKAREDNAVLILRRAYEGL